MYSFWTDQKYSSFSLLSLSFCSSLTLSHCLVLFLFFYPLSATFLCNYIPTCWNLNSKWLSPEMLHPYVAMELDRVSHHQPTDEVSLTHIAEETWLIFQKLRLIPKSYLWILISNRKFYQSGFGRKMSNLSTSILCWIMKGNIQTDLMSSNFHMGYKIDFADQYLKLIIVTNLNCCTIPFNPIFQWLFSTNTWINFTI